ncbi:Relaxin-3 receptor 1 [Merluccius polli]|uniref:Relaxin-3 receptor 1 n=1 Tax=Merluccius polli TaxID=89951 RepID=A0AA47NWI8_MERPO|nr:Relaxin-3 receptor 1 [Merluccius polli]
MSGGFTDTDPHDEGSTADSLSATSTNFTATILNTTITTNTTNTTHHVLLQLSDDVSPRDGSAVLRVAISAVYAVVCALGLSGNLLVLYLIWSKRMRRRWKRRSSTSSSIHVFVTGLAVTDAQFSLTLPFWAVENALDFAWVFGGAMCKAVSYATALSMYASVFFLTAMSVARYRSLAAALRRGRRGSGSEGCGSGDCGCGAKCASALIWLAAASAALPHAVFSTTATVSGEELCLVRFPDQPSGAVRDAQFWLGLYQAQKVLVGFVVPLGVIATAYSLLLLRVAVVRNDDVARNGSAAWRRRRAVTRSVTAIVLCFFLCWLPNQALTAWGVLVKLDAAAFSRQYYATQAYLFPVSVCLAHASSCLNPVLYCLARRDFREALRRLLRRIRRRRWRRWRRVSCCCWGRATTTTTARPFKTETKTETETDPDPDGRRGPVAVVLPVAVLPVTYPPGVVM